ncbi:SDR family NAD(P)-dependent oxidoreductase [Breoghania sp.]|uniref:SDR family NAD(P)-dependent oxidoreductase n=1 Tax=Breoghania sp. TaxID=2065378 RepID=UPI00260421C2|nr:SDR family NAD(P)-dependent oxidoreductase [Breoghania sp.]MDJ0933254.1 SDR family NAD(P)-dependent oxidoreductase [Breoghania sp.]
MAKNLPREPVAIVGVGLRLPGADSLDGFWEHLAAERSLISDVPLERWNPKGLADGRTTAVRGGFIEHADCFDAEFFGISPREAAWMDPQQRFALEMAWQAVEDAGYRASDLAGGRTGVFMGVCHWDYAELLEKHLASVDAYTPTGIAFSIIANRISHFFDFHGPSVTNDTACAASMTSIYEAVRAIQDGTCDQALAGGFNLVWSPNHFVAFSKAGMLSRDGRAKVFDEAADGYVRGEGGAILLLKLLSKAQADGDPIHAVICGIGVNHGGRTNSLTVTNPAAQADLICEVQREAGISPDTIGYVEAHGTGTPLGDPIEISGLKQAFETLAAEACVSFEPETCGIGSVKTNIGHLESAAGVAGIVKVLAALKHERLPANVGFHQQNQLIDLSGTPFRIQKQATDWPRRDGHPRRACVSSFGFGGSNGHVLLEEGPAQLPAPEIDAPTLRAVPLSAANEGRLAHYAAMLLRFVEEATPETAPLADIAHTYQVAREPMEARCVFLAHDLGDLAEALRAFLIDGADGGVFPAGIEATAESRDAEIIALARRFAASEDVDWPSHGRRIHVPVYPFERQRHWMDLSLGAKDQTPVPHPLLHRNTSGLERAGFETRLTGDEFVLSDHHVDGRSVLPGVACLEMARAAATLAGGLSGSAFALEDIVWSRPVLIEDRRAITVETALERRDAGELRFSVRTVSEEAQPNATGRIKDQDNGQPGPVDLDALKGRIAEPVKVDTCYDRLRNSGVDHGPAFRALARVNRNGEGEVLAQLRLPRRLLLSLDAMPLHPVLLDAAIQAWVATGTEAPKGAAVPFACGRVEVSGPCEATMWAHVRLRSGQAADAPVRTMDIDLLDKAGVRRIVFRDLSLRVLKHETAPASEPRDETAMQLFVTDGGWQPMPLDLRQDAPQANVRVLLAGTDAETKAALAREPGWTVEILPDVSALGEAEAVETLFTTVSASVREALRDRSSEPVNFIVLTTDTVPATAPLASLLKTVHIESPKLAGRVIRIAGDVTPDRLKSITSAESRARDTLTELWYDAGGIRRAWLPVSDTLCGDTNMRAIDLHGVYWITGGLGGLGRIFADWLISRGAHKLLLTGRRAEPDAPASIWLEAQHSAGIEIFYRPCDIADGTQVEAVAAEIARDHGKLKGIIHTAGVLDDGYILTQEPEQAAAVFAPKVAGTLNLDRATHDLPLDFFVLCSSIASVFGNAGQSVYAAANAFMDAFAERRAAEVAAGKCHGQTVAIAWPLWADGGMSADKATRQVMRRRLGLSPLPREAGLVALETILSGPGSPRSTVLYGDLERIDGVLDDYGRAPDNAQPSAPQSTVSEGATEIDDAALLKRTVDHLRDILADVLEMDATRIRANRKLEEYGLDSIAIVESTNRLEEGLGPLSKTLFFEYVDLEGVAGHLVAERGGALRALFADELEREEPPLETDREAVAVNAAPVSVVTSPPISEEQGPEVFKPQHDDRHDVAIVGLSLHVSNADTQEAFWKMLSEGIDGFEPVPSERWDNAALHHLERDVLGKTVVKTGCFLPDIDKFDPRYFRISQAEAELMSPEVRLFLQASVEAFEDAGYSRETMARRMGGDVAVIVGSMTNEYDLYGFQNMLMRGSLASGSYTGTVPNMVSYYYGFTGPSYFLDTMCSASSTCVHEAVHMLRAGRCRMALAGGVSLLLHPQKLIATSQEHFTTKSADVIRGYGLGAEGTILGEGVGALVLKPLIDAERDGDHIYGVITGSGISNAGVRNGFTVPNPNQQAAAIERALEDAGIGPQTIGYIEGHGSGTALGDPIEIKALTQVFRKHTRAVQTCPIGTVKSNVAHLLGASGLAGIVKVLAQLKHGQLAPSLHAETLNPDIPFATSPFYVQRELASWKRLLDEGGKELPRRAGVTSIGAGGMNSHILIEEYRAPARTEDRHEPDLLVFSALTSDRLRAVLDRFAAFLEDQPDTRLSDIAYTLQVGRNELTARLAFVARDGADVLAAICAFLRDGTLAPGMVHVPSILDVDPPQDREAITADCAARRLERVGAAWVNGAEIDWDRLNRGRDVRRISLPAYPFEKIHCWYQSEPDVPSVINPMGARSKLHPFIGLNRSDASGLRYTTAIHLKELRDYVWLDGGRETVLPTVAPEIVAAAARIAGIAVHPWVTDLRIEMNPDWPNVRDLEIAVEPGGAVRIDLVTVEGMRSCWVRANVTDAEPTSESQIDLEALRARAVEVLDHKAVYAALKTHRLSFGPYLESIRELWHLPDGGILCALREDQPQQDFFKRNTLCPALALGAAFEAMLLSSPESAGAALHGMAGAVFSGGDIANVLCRPEPSGILNIQFLDQTGRVVGTLSSIAMGEEAQILSSVPETNEQATPITPSSQSLRDDLRRRAADILKFAAADIGMRDTFHDLGFDSISLTRYANDLSATYGIDLSPAIFFECEHIEALADHLIKRHGVTVSERAKEPAPAAATVATKAPVVAREMPAIKTSSGTADTRIAVIGMAGRFPQSPDIESFFDNLLAGRDLTRDMPMDRYSPAYAEHLRKAGFTRHGGFLEGVDRFDAALFKVSPVEAERMDPQQRLLLESTWRTLEDAGYRPEDLPRDTGVFVGISALDYASLWRAEGLASDGYLATGNSLAMAANRLSHFFDLNGPSQSIDTACSSSLVALLRARDALLAGQCDAAIVGGVNLCLALEGFEGPALAGMLSPTGRCHTFGKAADGYARGEGVVTLLVKRLADAERDGDRILGVIAGGAENHGGRSGALTAPNAKAQGALIKEAMRGSDPASISYIEAHGTGTELGDPVEINGLSRAFEDLRGDGFSTGPSIGLGTVKSNIGHLEAAAGLAGVIKVLTAIRRGELPPTLHSEPLNPHINLDGTPFHIVTSREAWPDGGPEHPRRAGVSSFGFGGSNAHVVLESYDRPSGENRHPRPPRVFAETRFWLPGIQTASDESETLFFAADWQKAEVLGQTFSGRRIVIGCGVSIPESDAAEVYYLSLARDDVGVRYKDAARQVLGLLRAEMAASGHESVLVQLVVPGNGEGSLLSGLGGMLLSAAQEDPRIRSQVIEVPENAGDEISRWLSEDSGAPTGSHIRHRDGRREIRVWLEIPASAPAQSRRDGGVYLIAGGMGGLGRLLAEHIAQTTKGAVLVLAGSRPLDEDRTAFLAHLRDLGAVTAYRQVDLTNAGAVKELVDHVVEVHGGLNVVFHCAGVLRDGFIATKLDDDIETVLAPKIDGAVALREACAGLDLDAFVLFSSLAGPFGNAGQADYAAANGFLDALARAFSGRIKAIDWPLWRDGGMRVDEPTREALFRRMGQRPLETEAGLEALRRALGQEATQIAVVAGAGERIRTFFAGSAEEPSRLSMLPVQDHAPSQELAAETRARLAALFAEASGLTASAIDAQVPLEDYGIDSLMITRLNNALGDIFEDLPKTLFFRHRTLAAVSDYLVVAQPASCARWCGIAEPAPVRAAAQLAPSAPETTVSRDEPIAIIGMSGTYPDAPDLDAFWQNLVSGHDAVHDIPAERWSMDGFYEPDPDQAAAEGKSYSRRGAFLEGFAEFDPLFFRLSPRDAAAMDPQERLFLMSAWQALEDAGYARARLKQIAGCEHEGARVGVFAGVTKTGYALYGPYRTQGGARVRPTTSFASIANRVSHLFDFAGPSMPVDTMCSSSLTAIYEACEHLRRGSCAMAIAGGVNLYLHSSTYVELSAAHMLSPSGECRSFGEGADGFVPGEGVGCVLLKPLSQALADGDRIHALIRATAVNHGGRTNGFTVPSPAAQRDVVRAALDCAGLSADQIGYIEAHGTGTELGDPIEVDGLTQAFARDTTATGICALGSVKSSIGHLEAAAGIAGLTKVVLQMKNRTLVPSLHAERINPNIDLAKTPFTLQREAAPWTTSGQRCAGISSFGAGGANAHVIVEEWAEPQDPSRHAETCSGPQAIVLSARTDERLKEQVRQLIAFLRKTPPQASQALPDPAKAREALRGEIGRLLNVDPADIDCDETFDALGLDASYIPALRTWCEASFGASVSPAELDLAGSVTGLAEAVCAKGGEAPPPETALKLADIAYTLQVGREAMESRLAVLAGSVADLTRALEAWLAGREVDIPVLSGKADGKRSALAALAGDAVIHEVVARAWEAGRLEAVLGLWLEGADIDWPDLRRTSPPRIVSLPTYPFEKTRYWLPADLLGINSALRFSPDTKGADSLLRVIEARSGDQALKTELETLETALAQVLGETLRDLSEPDVNPSYRAWLKAARGLLASEHDGESLSLSEAWAAWEALRQAGGPSAQMDLAEAALRALPEILTGKLRATDILFPEGHQTLVEAVYKENQVAARFSRTVAEAAVQVAAGWSEPSHKLRILEIGAGTGGTSEPVFDALATFADRIAAYVYTDVSRAFLIHAERHYSGRVPGLKTALFDIEKPLAGQDVEPGAHDLVIAANVLHATADIHETLARVRETMAPGAVLLLNETSRPTLFTHVTFGLLEGWWRFTDPDRRIPGTPSLTAENWKAGLEASGFQWEAVSSHAEQALGQQIIVASASGAAVSKPVASTPLEEPSEPGLALRERLLAALGETLNMAPSRIDPARSFADYGLDSILGAEFVHRLRKALTIEVDQTDLFDFANVARLEQHLLGEQRELALTKPQAPPAAVAQPQQTISAGRDKAHAPIAIVGASGRFAKSETLDALWQYLKAGEDLIEPVSRFDLTPFYKDAEPGTYGHHGSFIDGIDRFDPVFFGISGVEATYMDPQQRLFLEEAWKTLESAGHGGEDMVGRRIGVFVGCAHGDYQELFTEQPPGQAFWGNTTSLIPSRISYLLDLKGPAVAIDTACSSSLVALHTACRSLRDGECEMALAGGVFVQCSPRFFRYANAAAMLSPTGHCAAFGAGADGMVPGEAVGTVLLRPLADALADGDTVLGLVVASSINQDGTTNGITAPSASSQERLIRQVYEDYDIDPGTLGYVEAHGTGTVLGDPIEHAALVRAFADVSDHEIVLGSVKSNIGHATTAAGFAGLAKVLLSLREETIPPSLHFDGGNPAIDFARGPFRVNTAPVSWAPEPGHVRRAAISSFGFGGTNAHVVVEEAPQVTSVREPAKSQLFVLSARTQDQLRAQAEHLSAHLEIHPDLLSEDVAFTLIAGRRAFSHRLAFVTDDLETLATSLRAWLSGDPNCGVETGQAAGDTDAAPIVPESADGDRRTEDLNALARRFLSGGSLDAKTLFVNPRRRVPLPTYPFAGKSYWVNAERPSKQQASIPIAPEEAVAAPSEPTGLSVRLVAPAAIAASVQSPAVVRSAKVILPPLDPTPAKVEKAGEIICRADEEGVCVLTLTGSWGKALATGLTRELEAAGADETVRAVILTGETFWQSASTAVLGFAPDCVLTCAVPVVVAVRGHVSGQPGAMALLADFLVADDEVRFEDIPAASGKLTAHLVDRRLAGDAGAPRVPAAEVPDAAIALARQIAQGPREALVLLKRHMRRELPLLLADFRPVACPLALPADGPGDILGSPRTIPLTTDVMSLALYQDGIAVLTMEEREGRNMFTPAFMDGLEEAFATIAALAEAKVAVLTGHDGYFSCGGTREGLADLQKGDSHFTDRRIYSLPLECELPVIAAMQGHGIGAGWSLGLYCDLTILAAEAVYHSNYLWYGFTPGAGATLIFPYRLGDDLGREILFTAREFRGRELGERSSRVLVRPGRDVLSTALAAARELACATREDLVAAKNRAAALLRGRLETVLERELAMHDRTFIGNEGVRARIAEKFDAAEEAADMVELEKTPAFDSAALEVDLVASLAQDLMIEVGDIRAEDGFLDLGLDSILAVTWIRNLNKRFEIDLPATTVYAYPTVKALTAHVAELVARKQPVAEPTRIPEAAAPPKPAAPAPRENLRREIIASLAEDLMLDPADIAEDAGFLDLGLDSILAVTWIRNLNKRYGIDLPATAVYAYPSVGALIGHISGLVLAAEKPAAETPPTPGPHVEIPASPAPQPLVETSGPEPIAIIGASGKFPKAEDLEAFWRNIASARDCIDEVPSSRWDIARFYDPDPQARGKSYCKWMGALDEPAAFDARFFNITPLEAELMDPQQRLFLEAAWHAIEDAAIKPADLSGKSCGVYVSSGPSGYEELIKERNTYSLLGSSGSILAARISYLLDLRGPCLSIDTACSSSLVAIAQACEALLTGTCDMALAGGACVLVGPNMFIDTSKVAMLSADGRCFTFDERANGFVPGEGIGALVLKRLSDAERDGDPIHAVIRGWGVNQDGRTNGITAPNPKAQAALLKSTHERFDIDPASIGLIECHGTGTALGDPIEVEGLTEAFEGVPEGARCALSSVKSNIGHLLASAGIAGALKAMLALEHRQLPPSVHVETLNSHIPFERTPFAVTTALEDWAEPSNGQPRRAGVSAFGFSGTNAHLVLEEYRHAPLEPDTTTPPIFVLSARTREQLIDYAGEMERFVTAATDLDLTALAATLQHGRATFSERLAFTFSGRGDLLRKLLSVSAGLSLDGVHLSSGDEAAIAVFTSDDEARTLVGKWLRSGETPRLEKTADLWAKGLDIDWPQSAVPRIHAPGYPFARTRYWIEPADTPQEVAAASGVALSPLFAAPPSQGEIGRMTLRINGDEPFLTTHVTGEKRLAAGLFLLEFARNALERLSGRSVSGLRQLLWGRPVAINGRPRDLTVTVMADAEGLLYRIEADGEDGAPCHLGSGVAGTDHGEPGTFAAPDGPLPGTAITETFRAFSERCAVHSGPPTPEMAQVTEVTRDGETLTARLTMPRGAAAHQPMLFDPFVLDAVWRLLTFRASGCVPDAGKGNALSFPLSIEAATGFAPLGDGALVRISGDPVTPTPSHFTVNVFDATGSEALRLEGVRLTGPEKGQEIRFEEELRS